MFDLPAASSLFDLPSPSALFERARAWFTGTTEDDGAEPSTEPDATAPATPTPLAEIVEPPRSVGTLFRPRSSMSDIDNTRPEQSVAEALTPREWDQLVDLVVDRLEDRVRDELARRGRRFSPGVF